MKLTDIYVEYENKPGVAFPPSSRLSDSQSHVHASRWLRGRLSEQKLKLKLVQHDYPMKHPMRSHGTSLLGYIPWDVRYPTGRSMGCPAVQFVTWVISWDVLRGIP